MKKIICSMICLMLLLTMAAKVAAVDTVTPTEGETPGDHQHSWTESNSATCEQGGVITRTCSCGATETVGDSPATGHQWDAGTQTTAPTCQSNGVKTLTCTRCRATRTEEIPMLTTHPYGQWITNQAGHSRECTLCHLPDSGVHNWVEEVVKAATCREDGSKNKRCSVCGYTETIVIPKLTAHTYDNACAEECSVCGQKRTVSHSFTTAWSKDYNGHWHECTKCGQKKDEAKHTPGAAATETTDQVCTTCGYVIAAKKPHTHSYGTEWTSDEVGHWHACTGCQEEKGYASHQFDSQCDEECNTCGYKRENSHVFNQDWVTTRFEHWMVCQVCGKESLHEKHVPGPEATETDPQLCSVCEFELAPRAEHVHQFGSVWHQDDSSHWQECDCAELSVPEAHVWNQGRNNQNDTITYACLECGAEKTEAVPDGGFPWLVVALSILALGCLGGIAVLVYFLKTGKFDLREDGDPEEGDPEEDPDFDHLLNEEDTLTQEQKEEKMIDDYFASLDKERYQ